MRLALLCMLTGCVGRAPVKGPTVVNCYSGGELIYSIQTSGVIEYTVAGHFQIKEHGKITTISADCVVFFN